MRCSHPALVGEAPVRISSALKLSVQMLDSFPFSHLRFKKLWPRCVTISVHQSSITQTCNHSQSGLNHGLFECLSTPACLSCLNSFFA